MRPFNTPCLRAALALCLWALWAAAPAPGVISRTDGALQPLATGLYAPAASLHAAEQESEGEIAPSPAKPDDSSSALYRVMWTVLIIWTAISVYLYAIDRKISRLERELNER